MPTINYSCIKLFLQPEIPAPAKNPKDLLASSTSKPVPCDNNLVAGTLKNDATQLDKKKSAVKPEQAMETLSQTVEKSKLKKRKLSHLGKKYALSRNFMNDIFNDLYNKQSQFFSSRFFRQTIRNKQDDRYQ